MSKEWGPCAGCAKAEIGLAAATSALDSIRKHLEPIELNQEMIDDAVGVVVSRMQFAEDRLAAANAKITELARKHGAVQADYKNCHEQHEAAKSRIAEMVPRSRHDVACDQYNEAEAKRKEQFAKAQEAYVRAENAEATIKERDKRIEELKQGTLSLEESIRDIISLDVWTREELDRSCNRSELHALHLKNDAEKDRLLGLAVEAFSKCKIEAYKEERWDCIVDTVERFLALLPKDGSQP